MKRLTQKMYGCVQDSRTPLHIAIYDNNLSMTKILVPLGADIHMPTSVRTSGRVVLVSMYVWECDTVCGCVIRMHRLPYSMHIILDMMIS